MHEVKYLGCNMNDKANPEREVLRKTHWPYDNTLNKLHMFSYNSDNTPQRKLQMFNAIIRSNNIKPIKCSSTKMLEKRSTKPTTYINRDFSDAVVRQKKNEQLKTAKAKPLVTLSFCHIKTRIEY